MHNKRIETRFTLLALLITLLLPPWGLAQEGRIAEPEGRIAEPEVRTDEAEGRVEPPALESGVIDLGGRSGALDLGGRTADRLVVAAAIGPAVTPGQFLAISAATGPDGLFVADINGRLFFHDAESPARVSTIIDELTPRFDFSVNRRTRESFQPRGLAVNNNLLYFFDGRTKQIWALDLWAPEDEVRRHFSTEFSDPKYLAVSPHDLVAVIDGGRLVFLQDELDVVPYERSAFPEPAGLAFSTWNTIHVLDRSRQSLVTITFSRSKSGRITFHSERESPLAGDEWRSMAIYNGVVYLANENRVFAYIETERKLIPILPARAQYARIQDIALTRNGLYLLNNGELELVPRGEPIDLTLEGDAKTSQDALISFYDYLMRFDMLPTRRVRAREPYEPVGDFLFDIGAVIAPPGEVQSKVQFDSDKQKVAYQVKRIEKKYEQRRMKKADSRFNPPGTEDLICKLNFEFCPNFAPTRVEQDQVLIVPDLEIDRQLGRERIVLKRPLGTYLDELVFSAEYRDLISPAFLKRINPTFANLDEGEVLGVRRGTVVVPVERWSVTAAVPAVEYADRESELWNLVSRFDGASMRSRIVFTEQSARSAPPAMPPDDPPVVDHCATLSNEKQRWLKQIKYPLDGSGRLISPELATSRVRVGVLEFSTTVLASHQVFGLNSARPTWHSFDLLSELVANPEPQTGGVGEQVALDSASFSPEAHHGTHVSALIAGRQGSCWSGLLQSARLVLVDLTDRSRVQRETNKAVNEGVKVFNVSQTFDGPQDDLRVTMLGEGRALWVVAAGNDGDDLDSKDEASVPAPARWGAAPNVVTVTASDWDGVLLEEVPTTSGVSSGVNRGKKYVDLVAPGENLYSASEQKKYGPATGTSQAVPQVAAAAAMLVDQLGERLTPGDAKARLIATADWVPAYRDKVWGGRLNFGAAVMFPDRDLLQTKTSAQVGKFYSIVTGNDPKIEILNVPRYYERTTAQGQTAPDKIRFSRILSLRRLPDGNFRVVLREPSTDRLKILLDAKLGDARRFGNDVLIKCDGFEIYNESDGNFKTDSACDNGLSITQIEHYVQGGNYQIQWEIQP